MENQGWGFGWSRLERIKTWGSRSLLMKGQSSGSAELWVPLPFTLGFQNLRVLYMDLNIGIFSGDTFFVKTRPLTWVL